MAEVVLENVVKLYPNGTRAVDGLSLKVAAGELLVIVGASGSGKTTTLRLIAGLEELTAGAVRIGGHDVRDLPPRRRDVAMVFQKHNLYPHMTVRENLAFGTRLRQSNGLLLRIFNRIFRPGRFTQMLKQERELKDRIGQTARLLGLEQVLEHLPVRLSGGEQQRAALGRALVRRPAVLLLDEPLSNLDWPLRVELRRELHLLHRRLQATMIYVTHDQTEAMTLGQRVAVLDRGTLQQIDRPDELYQKPANRFVAGFIGWPPMNLLEGTLIQAQGELLFEISEGGSLAVPAGLAHRWEPHRGRPLALGIRPEDVQLAPDAGLPAEVDLVEILGNDRLIRLRRGNLHIIMKGGNRDKLEKSEKIALGFDMRHSHLFDANTGRALFHGRPEG